MPTITSAKAPSAASSTANNIDNESRQLKLSLEGWRELLVLSHSCLVWERPADPAILFSIVSFHFLTFWLLDLSLITTIGFLGLLVFLMDFMAPKILSVAFKPESWTSKKEKKFESLCRELAVRKHNLKCHLFGWCGLRSEKPKLFYLMTITVFAFLTWLGSAINNLILTYLIVLSLVLAPGLSRKGLLQPLQNALAFAKSKISDNDVKKE